MKPKIFKRAVFLALGLFAVTLSLLALHPEPPTPSKPLFVGAQIDPSTRALFRRACQDCHSDNTKWPWYSRIPPMSSMIGKDVGEARRHINFSHWDAYSPDQQEEFLTRIGNNARIGRMPLPRYTLLHREASLTPQERQQIYEWSKAERKRLRTAADRAASSATGQ
jgi:hypothetical protein